MEQAAITRFITTTFAGVDPFVGSEEAGSPDLAWGDTFFIYDPDRTLEGAKRFPFATIVTKDYGEFDNASNLDRPGVFRLNIGVSKETYASLVDPQAEYDFTALDQLMPHPVYGRNHWVCVLNPSEATFETLKPLLQEAYDRAVQRLAASSRARRTGGT
jgi:predicted DNA-binding protein (MmcQ/YjbR family)